MLVDSHCHLDYLARDGDLDGVVERARDVGVKTMLTIGTKLSQAQEVIAIAERFDGVFASAGVHPHEAAEEGVSDTEALLSLAAHPKVVAIGETGLDFFYEHSPRQEQADSFRTHIRAARQCGLPLIVHSRDADPETIEILREEYALGPFRGVIHCFSTGPDLARAALDLGFYISLAGIVTFKKAEALRNTVRALPLDRVLVETDSPYLAPVPKRGKRNEPAYVAYTASYLAEMFQVPFADFAAATTANFFALFDKARSTDVGVTGSP